MTTKFTKIALPVLMFMLFNAAIFAQSSNKDNPITTAVPFLRLSADARTAAMGDAAIATSADVNSMFYNGAKTVFNKKIYGIGINYAPQLGELDIKNIYQFSLSSFYKITDNEAISLGVRNFSMGTFTNTDFLGQETGTSKPNDLAIEAGYSRKLSEKVGLGLNVRYINSNQGANSNGSDSKASTVAADITTFYTLKSGWNFGAALTNLGGKIKFGDGSSYIPAAIALGTSYNTNLDKDNKLSFALDLSKLMVPTPPDASDAQAVADYDNQGVVSSWFKSFGDAPGGGSEEIKEIQLALGTEYSYKDQFSLRAGYFSESKTKGNRNYVTVGAGAMYKVTGFNISYLIPTGNNSNNSALKNTFRLGLTFDFNDKNSK